MIAFVAAASTTGSGASVAANVPAGTSAGNVMLAYVALRVDVAFTAPVGWNRIGTGQAETNLRTEMYWKVATGSEPSTYTWSFAGSAVSHVIIAAYSGVDNTTPVGTEFASSPENTTRTAHPCPAVTTAGSRWLITACTDNSTTEGNHTSSDGLDVRRGMVFANSSISTSLFDSDRSLAAGTLSRTITSAASTAAAATWTVALRAA